MEKLKYLIEDYFGFSPKETKGFIVIIGLMITMLIIPTLCKKFMFFDNDSSVSDKKKLDSLVAFIEKNRVPQEANTYLKKNNGISLSSFNPNTIDQEGLLSLGIDEKLAKRILNYRNKGGQFRIKSDFKKMYGLSEQQYLSLHPYIELPEIREFINKTYPSSYKKNAPGFTPNKYEKIIFDMNKADTTQLQSLYGIGNKLAKRIITFRDKLGGFVSEDQYAEVYGLDSTVIKLLREKSLIQENFMPAKVNINTATFEILKEHPYIRFKIAKLLIAYRQQHGNFLSAEDIKKIKPISEDEFNRLKSYITL